jgi:hypothetical protein
MTVNEPHSKFERVYAIVRFDLPISPEASESGIAVVKVFSSDEIAEKEAARLNQMNADKKCEYRVYMTRFAG